MKLHPWPFAHGAAVAALKIGAVKFLKRSLGPAANTQAWFRFGPGALAFHVVTDSGSSMDAWDIYDDKLADYVNKGEADYDFGGVVDALSGLKLTLGYRYTWDNRSESSATFSLPHTCTQGDPVSCTVATKPSQT